MPNDIQVWGSAGGQLQALDDYIADFRRTGGVSNADVIEAAILNRLYHQLSLMATGLAQFVANRHAPGVVDTGGTGAAEVNAIEAGILAAVQAVANALIPGIVRSPNTWAWSDPGTVPAYLWGSTDGVNHRVFPPSRFAGGAPMPNVTGGVGRILSGYYTLDISYPPGWVSHTVRMPSGGTWFITGETSQPGDWEPSCVVYAESAIDHNGYEFIAKRHILGILAGGSVLITRAGQHHDPIHCCLAGLRLWRIA
jgi:hypothetical protein